MILWRQAVYYSTVFPTGIHVDAIKNTNKARSGMPFSPVHKEAGMQ